MPERQPELEAAWQALAERERRSDEATRQRAAELEERSARVSALWEDLGERSRELAALDADLAEREQGELEPREEDVRRRAAEGDEREPRVARLADALERRAGALAVAEAKVANQLRDIREEQRRLD